MSIQFGIQNEPDDDGTDKQNPMNGNAFGL